MAWLVGIDEAGYGPNLGPLVMTAVACRVPPALAEADLWRVLRSAVRRPRQRNDGRILVEDSKVIYSTTRGLLDLETGVFACLADWRGETTAALGWCLERLCPGSHALLGKEPWYSGTSTMPVVAQPADIAPAAARFESASKKKQVHWGCVRGVVVCASEFNDLLDQWGSKGAVLGRGLAELLRCNCRPDEGDEPVHFYVDKHGGRNTYSAMLQNALPEGMVVAHEESMERSTYSILGLGRAIHMTFQPRADSAHFCVALASMVSKYVRELLMLEFNRFWQEKVPGVRPTAGYPGDAARFFDVIRPALEKLGIDETAIWRRR